ncbi:MAG: tRNA (adenosine(37)-N6)-threonylcarbamoyltransferase complex dimerization subunit type 1 TsaB [Clostridia bacterium]|nr:tRNA (adenosine(37)-N6)-threonylcarbamoyltransferase complex dimerization subunit type 1 TsaB [Clostridia bacterium]
MRYLAVDTASKSMKVLLVYDDKKTYVELSDFKVASVSLMPTIDRCLSELDVKLSDLDFFACVIGPGSFTGIRIGMATIKAFAYVYSKPVVPVTSLELLAYNNSGEDTILSIMDASNGMRYVAVYDEKMNVLLPPSCLSTAELQEFLLTVDEPYGAYIDEILSSEIKGIVPNNFEKAFSLAVENNFRSALDGNLLEPIYIRKPQAERDLEKK